MTVLFGVATGMIVKLIGDGVPLVTVLMYSSCSPSPDRPAGGACSWSGFPADQRQADPDGQIAFGFIAMACWFTSARLPLDRPPPPAERCHLHHDSLPISSWRADRHLPLSAVITGMTGIILRRIRLIAAFLQMLSSVSLARLPAPSLRSCCAALARPTIHSVSLSGTMAPAPSC